MPELHRLIKKIQSDPHFKGAFGRSLFRILYSNQMNSRANRIPYCKEVVLTMPVVIYTKKSFYMRETFNRKIELLNSAGFIDFWLYENIDKRILNSKETEHREALTIINLVGCFQILFIGWAISFVAFGMELLSLVCGRLFIKNC